jgi:assimilatory nitrate reductase electron transfer subunit
MKIVIVGFGMAGARLADELSATDADVTVVGAETHPAYNRILLSSVLAGKHRPTDISMSSRAKARVGLAAVAVDRAAQTVRLADGTVLPYDHLVLATGSQALVPPVPGLGDAFTFRTLDDCHRILEAAATAQSALVLGGGLLGLEAARGLALRGLRVEVVHAVGHLMERQLDPAASRVLERTLAALSIKVHLAAAATSARISTPLPAQPQPATPSGARLTSADAQADAAKEGAQAGRPPAELTLADGRVLSADLLVVACGVRADVALAKQAGLEVDRGIVVDERLRTSDRRISALGDCAQLGGEVGGLVAPAWEQARVIARQLSGVEPLAVYSPAAPVTRLKASGIDLAAMGSLQADPHDEDLSFTDAARGTYARLLIRDDRVAGAVLLGDNPSIGRVIQLFDRRAAVPADRRALLLGRAIGGGTPSSVDTPALMPDGATVCQCNSVSKGELVRCWRQGAHGMEALVGATKATTGCGSCRDAVEGIVDWLVTAA